jgi:dienelactone hydrolase
MTSLTAARPSLLALLLLSLAASGKDPQPLPGTKLLTEKGDFSARMLDGMEKFLLRETDRPLEHRSGLWRAAPAPRNDRQLFITESRTRLRRMIGAVGGRVPFRDLEIISSTRSPAEIAHNESIHVHAVRWPVLEGVEGEGLLLVPAGKPRACIVALPDADQTPEAIAGLGPGLKPEAQWARRLAENGCVVVVPTLIDRKDTWSGNPRVWMTNCPHREWVYRAGFDLGRHIIGYEVHKVRALVGWFREEHSEAVRIGVAGYGEGGLLALYSSVIDTRIDAALVSGYFGPRQRLWEEPIYRNVFGVLQQWGDAELACLIAPRPLVIEVSDAPRVEGPPAAKKGRQAYAAPGKITTPTAKEVREEVACALAPFPTKLEPRPHIQVIDADGKPTGPGSEPALQVFLGTLDPAVKALVAPGKPLVDARKDFDPAARQYRQLKQLIDHTQTLLARSDETRRDFWSRAEGKAVADWEKSCASYREYLAEEVIGRFDQKRLPTNPRTRKILDRDNWTGYEVMLDVLPDVFLWGYLLVPKGIKEGERRPVVVCQHGLEGLPEDVINQDHKSQAYATYKAFGVRLAERGFVVFAPHHYYRGGNRFRQLQRMAHPLKKTLFAFVVAQHEQLFDWFETLPFVDAKRVGFYGLSYGGFSAMRLPALVTRYALSINSAEFNDMALKKCSVHHSYSYPFYNTYEVFEWDLANTFNYSDLAGLIAPRPFMVERGHQDSVAPDEWVASEYAKVRRRYVQLGIGQRTAIEFFDGPHTIHGVGTFAFLHKHLNWPEPRK